MTPSCAGPEIGDWVTATHFLGERLFISRRTAENHLAKLYGLSAVPARRSW